ncbi:conserved hypothetical protein, secreted [Beggiatoa sp. PS]|nr:conserved hypothetical protein, secreted [Beggiatoa sp. PS]
MNRNWLLKAALLAAIPISVGAQDLPNLGPAQATDVNNQPIESATTFTGGFAINEGSFLSDGNMTAENSANIVGDIAVDPSHVGQVADIVVYVNFATLDDPANPILLMLGENGAILPWNNDLADLMPFISQVTLGTTQRVEIYNNLLPEGNVQISFGYLLDDALVVTQQQIDITIESLPAPIEAETDDPVGEIEADAPIDPSPILLPDEDRLVGQWSYRWPVGSTLKVGFDFTGANFGYRPAVCYQGLSNSACQETLIQNVISAASGWSQYGNIYFKRSTWEDADIRVQFQERGSWSYVGMVAKQIARDQATLNLALSFLQNSEGFRRTTIHEFGHAIGLRHEHISPNVSYNWNEAQIIADLQQQGWPEDQTRRNIIDNLLKGNSRSAFFTTSFDPKSIMIYSIPKGWVSAADLADSQKCPDATTNRYYCVGNNTELSDLDKQGIAQFYPRSQTQSGVCSFNYDPTNYRPGTAEWDGHSGPIAFNNPTSSTVRVTLYHPDMPYWPYWTQDIPARGNYWVFYGISISMDWGIKVNGSPICIMKTVSDWKSSYFQATTTKIPGQ